MRWIATIKVTATVLGVWLGAVVAGSGLWLLTCKANGEIAAQTIPPSVEQTGLGQPRQGQRTDYDKTPPVFAVAVTHIRPVIALKDLAPGEFFQLARHWESPEIYMLASPHGPSAPNAAGQIIDAWYGITYQPSADSNSVYAVNCKTGVLWRMQAGLPCVREPRLTLQFRYGGQD